MQLFGFEIARVKAPGFQAVGDRGNWWWPIVREPFTGGWQRNADFNYHAARSRETVLAFNAVYACVTLIASDVAKLRIKLVEQLPDGTWIETTSPAFSPLLRKPNGWQTRIAFFQAWLVAKLLHGNAYVLLARDNRNVVQAMYVLDPQRVQVLVTNDGDVYYQLRRDPLSGVEAGDNGAETVIVPASEIIHDVMTPLFHPLVGVSPLIAAGNAATAGLAIQQHSSRLFANGATPGGTLTAPGVISQDQAAVIKARWEENYSGANVGRVAILGNGLSYAPSATNAVDAQLIEQLKWDQEAVCTAFKVPPYMIGIAAAPTHANVQAMAMTYYTQCLQIHLESMEELLEVALGLWGVPGHTYGVEFDIDQLLRMDTMTLYATIAEGVKGGFLAPDEGRSKIGLGPVKGGSGPYLQQQNYSLEALAKRDAQDNPFGPGGMGAQPAQPTQPAGSGTPPSSPPPEPAGTTAPAGKMLNDVIMAVMREGLRAPA